MAKDPAFLFYTNDFQSGTLFFTDEQLGKYLRLLMAQHQHGHLTEKQVLFISKSYDNDIMQKFAKDENDMFYNERLETEIEKRKSYSKSRSNNKSGKYKNDMNNISLSYDKHMENENKDVNKDVIINNNNDVKNNFKSWIDEDFKKDIWKHGQSTYPVTMCKEFYNYWSEIGANGKMRFQLQKTWETSKRLATWSKNFKGSKIETAQSELQKAIDEFNNG